VALYGYIRVVIADRNRVPIILNLYLYILDLFNLASVLTLLKSFCVFCFTAPRRIKENGTICKTSKRGTLVFPAKTERRKCCFDIIYDNRP